MGITLFVFWVLFILNSSGEEEFDPNEFDYCNLPCPNNDTKHSACGCSILAPLREVVDYIVHFRKQVFYYHNEFRNIVASGRFKKSSSNKSIYFPRAADMMVINYDHELEYIANCFAVSEFNGGPSTCTQTHNNTPVGQNIGPIKVYNPKGVPIRTTMIENWIPLMHSFSKSDIDSFSSTDENYSIAARLIWSKVDRVGCARVYVPELKERAYSVICNYATFDGSAISEAGKSIYKIGKPCSACPPGMECQSKQFSSLCGPITKRERYTADSARDQGKKEIFLIFISFFWLYYIECVNIWIF